MLNDKLIPLAFAVRVSVSASLVKFVNILRGLVTAKTLMQRHIEI